MHRAKVSKVAMYGVLISRTADVLPDARNLYRDVEARDGVLLADADYK